MENLYLDIEGQTYLDKDNISIIAQNTKRSLLRLAQWNCARSECRKKLTVYTTCYSNYEINIYHGENYRQPKGTTELTRVPHQKSGLPAGTCNE